MTLSEQHASNEQPSEQDAEQSKFNRGGDRKETEDDA